MPSELGQEFNDVARYPYMAVASPSCHDTTTTRLWWEEDAGRRERLFFEELHLQARPHTPDLTTPGQSSEVHGLRKLDDTSLSCLDNVSGWKAKSPVEKLAAAL